MVGFPRLATAFAVLCCFLPSSALSGMRSERAAVPARQGTVSPKPGGAGPYGSRLPPAFTRDVSPPPLNWEDDLIALFPPLKVETYSFDLSEGAENFEFVWSGQVEPHSSAPLEVTLCFVLQGEEGEELAVLHSHSLKLSGPTLSVDLSFSLPPALAAKICSIEEEFHAGVFAVDTTERDDWPKPLKTDCSNIWSQIEENRREAYASVLEEMKGMAEYADLLRKWDINQNFNGRIRPLEGNRLSERTVIREVNGKKIREKEEVYTLSLSEIPKDDEERIFWARIYLENTSMQRAAVLNSELRPKHDACEQANETADRNALASLWCRYNPYQCRQLAGLSLYGSGEVARTAEENASTGRDSVGYRAIPQKEAESNHGKTKIIWPVKTPKPRGRK